MFIEIPVPKRRDSGLGRHAKGLGASVPRPQSAARGTRNFNDGVAAGFLCAGDFFASCARAKFLHFSVAADAAFRGKKLRKLCLRPFACLRSVFRCKPSCLCEPSVSALRLLPPVLLMVFCSGTLLVEPPAWYWTLERVQQLLCLCMKALL